MNHKDFSTHSVNIVQQPVQNQPIVGHSARTLLLGLALGLLLLVVTAGSTQANSLANSLPTTPDNLAQKTLVISFQPGTDETARNQVIARTGGQLVRWIPALDSAVVRLPDSSLSQAADAAIATAQSQPQVRTAAFDGVASVAFTPNDPDFNNASLVFAPQLIQAPAAWDATLGQADVVIAMLDTGIQMDHEEFQGRLMAGYDFQNDDPDPMDDQGHGTHVAGIAGAGTDNGLGMAGICGGCTLLPVKVLDARGSGLWSTVAAGIVYAADQGADIINLSLGGYSPSTLLQEAVIYAQDRGVLVVAAAGNHASRDNFYPAAFDGVLGVAATTAQDTLWVMSNRGTYVDVSAPGETIYSTTFDENRTDAYTFMSGTSMATPHVSGLAGLLLSLDPTLSAQGLHEIIRSATLDLAGADATVVGNGRIDAQAAVARLGSSVSSLTGRIWQDDNQNGIQDANEANGIAGLTVSVANLASGVQHETQSDSQGIWHFSDLAHGDYLVQLATLDDLYSTTPTRMEITIGQGESSSQHDFGLSESLPATAVTDFTVERGADQVSIRWRVTHLQVQATVIQRSTSANGPFETIMVVDADQAFLAEQLHVVDILPTQLMDGPVFYRLTVEPSQLIVGPIAAMDGQALVQIFLPHVNNR